MKNRTKDWLMVIQAIVQVAIWVIILALFYGR